MNPFISLGIGVLRTDNNRAYLQNIPIDKKNPTAFKRWDYGKSIGKYLSAHYYHLWNVGSFTSPVPPKSKTSMFGGVLILPKLCDFSGP